MPRPYGRAAPPGFTRIGRCACGPPDVGWASRREEWSMSGEYASVGTQTSGVTDRAYAAPQAGLGWISFAVVMLGIAGTLNADPRDRRDRRTRASTWAGPQVRLQQPQHVGLGRPRRRRHAARRRLAIWADTQFGPLARRGARRDRRHRPPALPCPASPFGALALFALDILIVYGLVAHGGRRNALD